MDHYSAQIRPATGAAVSAEVPRNRSLVDERFDHDSCGVGFVATVGGVATHQILNQALTALARLAHRGATLADGKSSDGVGLMTDIPRALLLKSVGIDLAPEQALGVGMIFAPAANDRPTTEQPRTEQLTEPEQALEDVLERCLSAHGLAVLAWRDVPFSADVLGEIALSAMPRIRQVLVVDIQAQSKASHLWSDLHGDRSRAWTSLPDSMERRLYLARKQFERMHEQGEVAGYICSLSTRTLVYKAMCAGTLLSSFYPDLQDAGYTTRFAIFHQRYATNTTPSWHRAQPVRTLAHNGEINTIWGNRGRMAARDATLPIEC